MNLLRAKVWSYLSLSTYYMPHTILKYVLICFYYSQKKCYKRWHDRVTRKNTTRTYIRYGALLWTKCLCLSQICMLKPQPQVWWYLEVIRSWRWSPHDEISVLMRRDLKEIISFLAIWGYSKKVALWKPVSLSPRHIICHHFDLGPPSLQNSEKHIFVYEVYSILW